MDVATAAVVGAGLMGHAIAQELAAAGRRVVLQDVTTDALAEAMEGIRRIDSDG